MVSKIKHILKTIILILCGYILLKHTTVTASSTLLQFILSLIIDVSGIMLMMHAGYEYSKKED